MRLTSKWLRRQYGSLNLLWYDGQLPDDVEVRFADVGRYEAVWYMYADDGFAILVHERLARFASASRVALLHEMVHLSCELRGLDHTDHGCFFVEERGRLKRAGAYDEYL